MDKFNKLRITAKEAKFIQLKLVIFGHLNIHNKSVNKKEQQMQKTAVEEVKEPINTIKEVNVVDITIVNRKRDVVEARVAVLEDSIDEIGLLQPIIITSDFVLVGGRHRLEVFIRKGWKTIPAIIKEYNGVDAELAEIDENLVRFELTPFERSMQYARRKELYDSKYPKAVKDDEETSDSSDEHSLTFVKDTAAKTGRSTTQIREEANLGKELLEKLTPEVRSLIAPTKVANNKRDLKRLVDEPDRDVQLEAAQMVSDAFEKGNNLNITDALRKLSGNTSFESTVSMDGEATLHTALKRNLRILESSVTTPTFKTNAESWTEEGVTEIREEFYRIERLAQRGAEILTDILDAK